MDQDNSIPGHTYKQKYDLFFVHCFFSLHKKQKIIGFSPRKSHYKIKCIKLYYNYIE